MTRALKVFTPKEIRNITQGDLNSRKAPGYDIITRSILKEIPRKCIVNLTNICNSIIRTEYFPVQRKVTQIIMISKSGMPLEEVSSCRPVGLQSIMSKIFEKATLERLRPILEEILIFPDHQFEFRQQYTTIQHRGT
jgi:hypothetical protein